MRIVVLGGTGLVGSIVVERLRAKGHEAVSASPSTGIDAVTGAGLDEAFAGADAVVDATNPRDVGEQAAIAFFAASTRSALAAEARAGVGHHVALSIVGVDRDPDAKGYLAGKVVQEGLIQQGSVPFTIVRATQFFEFLEAIADGSTVDGVVRLAPVSMQPVAAAAVARVLVDAATGGPTPVVEVAGPERAPIADLVGRVLAARGDGRRVIADPEVGYFGRDVGETSLVPVGDATVVDPTTLDDWLDRG